MQSLRRFPFLSLVLQFIFAALLIYLYKSVFFPLLSLHISTQVLNAQIAFSCGTVFYTLASQCEGDGMWGV